MTEEEIAACFARKLGDKSAEAYQIHKAIAAYSACYQALNPKDVVGNPLSSYECGYREGVRALAFYIFTLSGINEHETLFRETE